MTQQTASVRLAKKALTVYAREIGEEADDLETVMADFMASMMTLADHAGIDFDTIISAARALSEGGF